MLKIENKEIKDRIIRDIRTLFKQEDDYYKPERVSNFWNNNYIEYESNNDSNKNLSLKEYLDKTKPCLKDRISRQLQLILFLQKMLKKSVYAHIEREYKIYEF